MPESPSVVRAGTQATILELEDRIAAIDYQLSDPGSQLTPEDEEILNRLEQRSDDTEEKVKVRLEQFHANVEAVKDSYLDIMVTLDGNRAPDVVSSDIIETINAKASA